MKRYKVFTVEKFDRAKHKLTKEEQKKIDKVFLQLRDNPYVGDQLRYRFLREKRIRDKRMYYLIYDDLLSVLVVAISDKKTQKETIDEIVMYFDDYRKYMRELIMDDD